MSAETQPTPRTLSEPLHAREDTLGTEDTREAPNVAQAVTRLQWPLCEICARHPELRTTHHQHDSGHTP